MIVRTPFSTDKNLFKAYNDCIEFDWIAVFDHDVLIGTDPDWFVKLEGYDKKEDEVYTGYTNRVNCRWQIADDCPKNDDIWEHREFAKSFDGVVRDMTARQRFSGFFFMIHSEYWEKLVTEYLSFSETWKYYNGRLLGLDCEIHEAIQMTGGKLIQLPIYFYHWYRGGTKDKSHLL